MEITKGKRVALIIIISLLSPLYNDHLWNYIGIEFFLQYAMLFAIAFVLMYFITRKIE